MPSVIKREDAEAVNKEDDNKSADVFMSLDKDEEMSMEFDMDDEEEEKD